MRGQVYHDNILKNQDYFVLDFTTFCRQWLHLRGYQAVFDRGRLKEAHFDWVTLLSCWTAETVVRSARGESLDETRRSSFLTDAKGEFFESARSSSPIKRAGGLLSCLVDSQPVAALFRHQKLNRSNVAVIHEEAPPHLDVTVPNTILESAPTEFLSFLYCWDRFFELESERADRNPVIDVEVPPMTHHYLQNMVAMLYARSFTPTSLYMIFKSFDLLAMDHSDELSWGSKQT